MNDIKIRASIDHMCYLHSTNPNCKFRVIYLCEMLISVRGTSQRIIKENIFF